VLETIRDTGKMPEGDDLVEAINSFKQAFEASETTE
jgi:hypothetical protein